MNDKPCNSCRFYDPILQGDGSKKARRGWCVKKSQYHHVDQPGHVTPPEAKRVGVEDLRAKPFIVVGSKVQKHCADFQAAPTR